MPPSNPALTARLSDAYQHHQPWLQGWFRRRLGDAAQAEDLSQDAFIRLLRAPRLPVGEEVRALLTTIAKGLLIDHYRHDALEKAYLAELAQQPETLSPSPEQRAEALQYLIAIDRLLDGLSLKARTAFLLSRIDKLTHAEIAAQLQVSASRVRQYLAQALLQLYQLDDAFGTPT